MSCSPRSRWAQEGITTFCKDELLLYHRLFAFSFLTLPPLFAFAAQCIKNTAKDSASLLSGQVADETGNYFSFKEIKNKQFFVFYRTAKFDSDPHF